MTTEQTYDLLKPVIAQMDVTVTCSSVTDNMDGTYTFACPKTKWAGLGFEISILGNSYRITNVIFNTSITVQGSVLPVVLTFDLYRPFFKHGTLKTVSAEQSSIIYFKQRLPLIWLREVVTERLHFDQMDAVDSDNDVQLYFATNSNLADWSQDNADTLGIAPMRSMVSEFIKALVVSQYVAEMTSTGEVKSYKDFGIVDGKNVFNEPLCAVSLRITIPFLKGCECCENPLLDNRPAPGYVLDGDGNVIQVLYSNETYTIIAGPCAGVTITDQDGNILTTVASGGNYPVTVLTQIRDTIDANTASVIDNIN